MKGRCDEQEARGSAISLFWGRWKLDKRQNTKINLLSLVNIFFSAIQRDNIKPFESALGQPLPQSFLGMEWLKT